MHRVVVIMKRKDVSRISLNNLMIFLINMNIHLDSDQHTENDYHYDSYEREDSDNETNGNRNSSK